MPPLAGNTTPFMNYTLSLTPDQELAHYKKPWTASKSSSLYKIHSWGVPYFTVNAEGNMAVHPFGRDTKPNEEIDIMKAVQKVMESRLLGDLGLSSPLIVRFPDVLKDRLERLQFAFDSGIKAHHYQGQFQGVFPVKCNQDRFVVENIVEFGKPYGFGLEAGSKPELLLAMASLCRGSPNALLVCNGYKDADYVCLALMAKQLRLNCVIVLEQEEELDVVLNMSRKLCIEPLIGLRAKLNTKHAGHFGETSGENGKFGLSCSQIINIVHKLRRLGMLHCLQLLHFHIGSQIPSLAILNDGVSEAAHIYCELNLMGANMQYIDIGGGLGIDYDGSSSAESDMSVGYTMLEYAKEVVLAVKSACLMKGVKQPTLCSESGRALVSHHSVLVFDVLSAQEKGKHATRDKGVPLEVDGTLPEELRSLQHSLTDSVHAGDYKSMLEHAKQMKVDCIDLFKRGELSLMQLASVNSLFEVVSALLEEKRHEMVSGMGSLVSCDPLSYGDGVQVGNESSYNAIYHINLSIFKSMPDTWAIGQLFPIVPLHRLEEEPTVRAILSDLTCDSDGKITTFLGSDGKGKRMNFMKVHPLQDGKPYFMGMFLGGAYQEALGGMHNLFGAPPVVHAVRGNKGGGSVGNVKVIKVSDGQKASDVLRGMQYDPISMMENLSLQVQKCLKERNSGEQEEVAMTVMHTLACSFASSTYLSTNNFASSVVSTMFQPTATGCFALI